MGLDALVALFASLNTNKVFWGISLILMNLGSRFVIADLNKVHEKILMMDLIKKLVLFCMFFVGCRDVMISLVLTFAFSIVMNALLNANSRYSMIPKALKKTLDVVITDPEYTKAKEIVMRYEKQANETFTEKNQLLDSLDEHDAIKDYQRNLSLLLSQKMSRNI